MKKDYVKPELETYGFNVNVFCLDASSETPADPTQPSLSKGRTTFLDSDDGDDVDWDLGF